MEKLVLPESITGGALEKSEKNEEERRLFFVALTRAKSILEVSFPASKKGDATVASEFVKEIGVMPQEGAEIDTYLITPATTPGMFQLEFEQKDLAYLRQALGGYRLSPTDLNAFLEDPKEFFKRVVLKYPFTDNATFIFGRTYHEALEKFFLLWKKDAKKPSIDTLLEFFMISISRAILTPAELEDAKKRGDTGLR